MTTSAKKISAGTLIAILLVVNTALMLLSPLGKTGSDAVLFIGVIAVNYLFILGFAFYVLKYIDNPANTSHLLLASATFCPAVVILLKMANLI